MSPRFPRQLATHRLLLRCWRADDAPSMRQAIDDSDAHLRPWIPFMRHEPRSMEGTVEVLERAIAFFENDTHFRYAVWQGDALVGEVMLLNRGELGVLEVGYWLHADWCGQGYAFEAVEALVELAFGNPEVQRLTFQCDERNGPSTNIPRKLGAEVLDRRLADDTITMLVWKLDRPDPVPVAG